MAYGAGFSYPNIEGHIPHQYRHAGSAPSSGLMSPYPGDYGSSGGSGGGPGAFSPSHQYSISQNPAMPPGSQMQPRPHGPAFPAGHHGQQHRSFPNSGHRMTPQYPHFSPQGGTSTASSEMYSPPPQRYLDGSANTGFDPKVNSALSVNSNSNSVSSSIAANNVGAMENVQQSYHASNYPGHSPQTHSIHKQATIQHRTSQHNVGVSYDNSIKMQHQGASPSSVYAKHHQGSNPSLPQVPSQEVAKSPMHPNSQQTQINQNFSPISNPSPAASAVHSPSCSSSPSPLMGVPESHVNPSGHGPPHPPASNPRSTHGHSRLLQTMPQLSPTPNSNGSISSCGSSSSHKAHSLSAVAGSNHPTAGRNKMGLASREEGSSVYSSSPQDRMQDAGLNSLNALSSQVANLPNTVQHMLLTDTVLSQKKAKDGGPTQQATYNAPPSQPRSRNASAASSTSTIKEGSGIGISDSASFDAGADEDSSVMSVGGSSGTKVEREEQFSEGEHRRARQMSGASSGSEPASYHTPQNPIQIGQPPAAKMASGDSLTKETCNSDTPKNEANNLSSSASPPFGCQSSEAVPASHLPHPVSSSSSPIFSSIPPTQPNFVPETGLTYNDHKAGHRKTPEIRNEIVKKETEGPVEKTVPGVKQFQREGGIHTQTGQDKENRLLGASRLHNNEKEEKFSLEDQQSASSVGVIVSARSEGTHPEKSKLPQENSIEEKQPLSYLRESSHNGKEGVDLSMYSSHHQKSNFGRPQNPPQSGRNNYGHPESTYGSDLPIKNRGRAGPVGVMESNSRYAGYQQSQAAYGPMDPKEANSLTEASVKKGLGAVPKGHEDNAQMQQFPSLLQEVLQGYNLDRRYGRPEQAFPAHFPGQQQFPTRHSYNLNEAMRVQSGVGEAFTHSGQMGSTGKPPHSNQKHGSEPDFTTDLQPSVKSEISNSKVLQNVEKTEVGVSQSHLPRTVESQQPPPKHINLADYSLPQRKGLANVTVPSSAVQELLLQEPEPLAGSTGQTESQKPSSATLAPSERRSVICDVSPNTRSTPERDRESDRGRDREKSQSGASVIQQPFSSPTAASDLSKKDGGHKPVKMEMTPKEVSPQIANLQTDLHGSGGANEAEMEYHSKSFHSSVVMNSDPYRRGNIDITSLSPHPMGTHPLSSPSRHPSYLHSVDLSSGGSSGFPGYRYGDAREGNLISRSNPHFPPHHPYHNLSPQPQFPNKLQMYPHPRGPPHHAHEMSEWVKAMNRPSKEMMMQLGSSPGRQKVSQSEHRQRVISQPEIPSEQHITKSPIHHRSPYYDLKMWESAHSGREGAMLVEGDSYFRTQAPPPPPLPPPTPSASLAPLTSQMSQGQNAAEAEITRGPPDEAKSTCPPIPTTSNKNSGETNPTQPQVQRQTKAGGSAETNPLMLRRRVRSFISPIPAKRLLQDSSQPRAVTNSHHLGGAHPEQSHHPEDDSFGSDISCPRLSSPSLRDNTFSQPLSPSSYNTKALSPRKGRGLKLEAIVQKITPSPKKPTGHVDDESTHDTGFSHSEMTTFNDSQDQDLAHFPRVTRDDDSYLEETHSLNEMISFRGVDETGPLPPSAYPHQSSKALKQKDFDFGLGTDVAVSGDKEDFALLGPLPPAPPLPRPVQGSPPPSSSALSDIQHFTNTYQQLETRRGEQSAANLLRQKLQETGIGFDDYPGSDYYGTTPPHHGHVQGHMLNRQHQMSSMRSSLSPQDSKPPESIVPKGYFPSGKKKGRPVGSVNKQKRSQNPAQAQVQGLTQTQGPTTAPTAPPMQPSPAPAPAAPAASPTAQIACTTPDLSVPPPLTDSKYTPQLAPPILTQVVKVDAESEDTQPETDIKPARRRRKGVKDEEEALEAGVRQRRRRRGATVGVTSQPVAKDDPDTPLVVGANSRVFIDLNRKGLFIPHIHVENKVPEIGAVCTIVNAEEDKTKGERSAVVAKVGGSGIDSLLTLTPSSQLSRRDRESEKREADEVETALQAGKALPTSGHVVAGPVITETNHSGRLLCCLCQKWANYKHLGDLYGPFYPAEYAAKLPKNQPQVRQCQATQGTNKTGPNSDISALAALSAVQDTQTQDAHFAKNDFSFSLDSNPASLAGAVLPAFLAGREEGMAHMAGRFSNSASSSTSSHGSSSSKATSLTWDSNLDARPIPELKREADFDIDAQLMRKQQPQSSSTAAADEAQQRPQHRKLTSHPRFKRRHKSSEDSPRMVPSNSKASLPFQPPPPALDSLGPLAQLAQLPQMPMDPEELWVHEGCIVWTSGVYLVNGRLYGLQEALDGTRETVSAP